VVDVPTLNPSPFLKPAASNQPSFELYNSTMSHCHDDHNHSGHGDSHDHSNDITPALQTLLYEQIDFDGIRTLNEKESGSGRKIVQKTWAQKTDTEPELESDADEQLILHVPYAVVHCVTASFKPPVAPFLA